MFTSRQCFVSFYWATYFLWFQQMRIWAWVLMYAAMALIVYMAIVWTRSDDDVEGFEDDEMRQAVIDEFERQKGSRPTPKQMNDVLDIIMDGEMTIADVPTEVAKYVQEIEDTTDPLVKKVIDEFMIKNGKKPTLEELNVVVDAVESGAITEEEIQSHVMKVISGDIPTGRLPDNVYKLVIDVFRKRKGSRPNVQEFDLVLDAIEDGSLKVVDVGQFVQDIVDGKIDVPEPPPVPYAPKPVGFDMNRAIIEAYLEHAGRRPNVEELNNVKAAVESIDDVLKFVQDTVPKADIIRQNVRAASEMNSGQISDAEIDKIVDDVNNGRRSIQDVIAMFSGADMADIDTMDELEDDVFVEEVYKKVTGDDVDPDTAVFLMAKLRSWGGDRKKVHNLIVTMSTVISDDEKDKDVNARLMRALIDGIQKEDVETAAADWNMSKFTRRPAVGESAIPKMTSMDRAFNMNIGDTDRLILAATRRSRGPSHDVLSEGEDMVLRDDIYWEFPSTKMPCPNQTCGDPEYRNSQSSLIGTLLDSAEKTSVGTLMPEFEFRELPPRTASKA